MAILDARETRFGLADLIQADAVLLTNSLIRLRWLARLPGREWPRPVEFDVLLEKLCSDA
jgi:hypothetical protein